MRTVSLSTDYGKMTREEREIYVKKRAESMRVLRDAIPISELGEEEIRTECEAVRQEIYNEIKVKKG